MTTASDSLKVAVCQLTSTDVVERNIAEMIECLREVERTGSVDLVCFPENALYLRVQEAASVPTFELNDSRLDALASWAIQSQAALHLGSVPLRLDGRTFNTSVLIHPSGQREILYHKTHLFDVDVEGQKPVRESDVFSHGSGPQIFHYRGWNVGSSICYDIRFAELFLAYARAGVDAVLIPSAFLVTTGQAHWEVLVRARAIESQCYVLAAAQGGTHKSAQGGTRATYGHSMIVDPWGKVLGEIGASGLPRVLRAELLKRELDRVRRQIPMHLHRRLSQ